MAAAADYFAPYLEQLMSTDKTIELWKSALGQELKQMRKARNLTQSEFAPKLGLSESALSKLERGLSPMLDSYIAYALELDMEVITLFAAADLVVRARQMRPSVVPEPTDGDGEAKS